MTSLSEVYETNARGVPSLRRLYVGTALVLAGALLAVFGVLVATSDLFGSLLGNTYTQREYGGIFGGLALPVALLGVFVVFPASRRIRAGAAISASICVLGVALFWYAYPSHWDGYGQDLTLYVSGVYLLGVFAAVWCLFAAAVTFKTRNDPGGTLQMNVTHRKQTTVVEVDPSSSSSSSSSGSDEGAGSRANSRSPSGIGVLGLTPDGEVETQTNRPTRDSSTESTTSASASAATSTPASDGGADANDINPLLEAGRGYDAEILEDSSDPAESTDRYCGNCASFDYIRTAEGMTPYCEHHDEAMDDMDACEEWAPNNA